MKYAYVGAYKIQIANKKIYRYKSLLVKGISR